ncbi:LysE family translocator [Corynebacterium sp. P5875]|uniref:LysE family translocator n=1 Tax=Corynebacterium antarcticum TaxID=2800405 RepID=A0A9Q4GMS5_9CORY|nr:LysE family translocator [Corynebacterium antarcticum]MCX7538046.1 LysE family translocator [Corynebacterium antarcticum]
MLSAVLALTVVSAVLIAVPGPSIVFLVGQALAVGRRPAMAGVVGNTLGIAFTGVLILTAVGTIAARTTSFLTVLRWVGVVVLIALGVVYLRAAWHLHRRPTGLEIPEIRPENSGVRSAFISGLLVGASNPKVIVMFGTIIPGYLPAGVDPLPGLVILSLVPLITGLIIDAGWVEAAARVRGWLTGSEGGMMWIQATGGLLLLLMAALVAAGH